MQKHCSHSIVPCTGIIRICFVLCQYMQPMNFEPYDPSCHMVLWSRVFKSHRPSCCPSELGFAELISGAEHS